jgi:chemotaxis protein methyltransferase CheR
VKLFPPTEFRLARVRLEADSAATANLVGTLPVFVGTEPDPALVGIRDLIYRVCGIFHADHKLPQLARRCERRMQLLGTTNFDAYLHQLDSGLGRDEEIRMLLNEITVGETCFYRDAAQLDALNKVILPELRRRKFSRPCRFWSAGCSTGEEPYTLAICLLEYLALRENENEKKEQNEKETEKEKPCTFEIAATDLNDNSLAKAAQGLFTEDAVRKLSAGLRKKYFRKEGPLYRICGDATQLVKFSRLNLVEAGDLSTMAAFDVVFCCNVLIYFDASAKRRVLHHFYDCLRPGGYLFLGESESLHGIDHPFRLVHFPNATGYLRAFDQPVRTSQRF